MCVYIHTYIYISLYLYLYVYLYVYTYISNDKQYAQQAIEQIYEELESAVLQCAQLVIKQTCQKQGPVVRRFLYIYIYIAKPLECLRLLLGSTAP